MAIISVKIDKSCVARIGATLEQLFDPNTRQYMHHRLGAYFEPYVPKESGALAQTTVATSDYLEYTQKEYAHYQYEGIVYGPNCPIRENGIIIGWYSPVAHKHPTDRFLSHSNSLNPRATAHWDVVAMAEHSTDFADDVARYVANRFNAGG